MNILLDRDLTKGESEMVDIFQLFCSYVKVKVKVKLRILLVAIISNY